ncbi:MAG: ribonuclease P protein component [Candidatus Sungiibacteriota bacterium]|uniref:Ribonuclease P protein component n=1 Tax=Candidatus Sungiibacteriota bacterium TaxID=2750080 RepID=A0A7T5UPI7_9BACT|nr:MAG: ribonuclease P protein component [Candidatus Sungbacteria bacterium]
MSGTKKLLTVKNPKDFHALLRRGQKTESPFFRVVVNRTSLSNSRFVFVAPKSVDRRSTKRNVLRRRLREWVRRNPNVFIHPSDFLIFIKKEAAGASRTNFYEDFKKTLERAAR